MERLRSFTNGLKPNICERIGQLLPQVHKIDHFVTWVLQPVGPQKGSTVAAYSGSLAKITTWDLGYASKEMGAVLASLTIK